MPMLHTLSIVQALDIWGDLEEAYQGEHTYGGDIAEIYAYRLKRYDPTLAASVNLEKTLEGMNGDRIKMDCMNAQAALVELVLMFCKRRECKAQIDDLDPHHWIRLTHNEGNYFLHRCHVKIIREDGKNAKRKN